MNNTQLEYLDNMELLESNATLLDVRGDGNSISILLDKTIFYPQGGGQQSDIGQIESAGFAFAVNSVSYTDGFVFHNGTIISGDPKIGMNVSLFVDRARRDLNSRLHSAGHLILNAMNDAGQILIAQKGYHFPDGPYVEFSGSISEGNREQIANILQTYLDELIASNLQITTQMVPFEKLSELCKSIPSNVPTNKPTRIVTINGLSQPCGGTHVASTGVLQGMRIEKIRSKKGDTRISYSL